MSEIPELKYSFLWNLLLVVACSGMACYSWLKADDYHAINNFHAAYLWYGYGFVVAILGIAILKNKIAPSDKEFKAWVDSQRIDKE